MMARIRLLLVDDHVVVRQGLRALLELERDLEVVGEAGNGREALAVARRTHPDVVVMDVVMPELNGVEATRQILEAIPSTQVLVLSTYGDEASVMAMMEAGAAGYVVKQRAAAELSAGIRQVMQGNGFLSPGVARRVRERLCGRSEGAQELTRREREVLGLIAQGLLNKQIAGELDISRKTVEKHRQRVMDKLRIHNVAGLTRYAITSGMVEPEPAGQEVVRDMSEPERPEFGG